MSDYLINKAHLRLRSGLLSQLPLLYTAGEIVIHAQLGPCEVMRVKGDKRQVDYVESLEIPKHEHVRNLEDETLMWLEHTRRRRVWVDVDSLRWLMVPNTLGLPREKLNLMDVRSEWLATLNYEQKLAITKGVDYATMRFDQGR